MSCYQMLFVLWQKCLTKCIMTKCHVTKYHVTKCYVANYCATKLFLTKGLVTRKKIVVELQLKFIKWNHNFLGTIYCFTVVYHSLTYYQPIYLWWIQTMIGGVFTKRKRKTLALLVAEGGFIWRISDLWQMTDCDVSTEDKHIYCPNPLVSTVNSFFLQ